MNFVLGCDPNNGGRGRENFSVIVGIKEHLTLLIGIICIPSLTSRKQKNGVASCGRSDFNPIQPFAII
jgi:hypothetical protein